VLQALKIKALSGMPGKTADQQFPYKSMACQCYDFYSKGW
jgi:hypothetical protein